MSPRFVPAFSPPAEGGPRTWFAFRGAELLVVESRGPLPAAAPVAADLGPLGLAVVRSQHLGSLDGRPAYAAELDDEAAAPPGHRFAGLRALHDKLDPVELHVAGVAFQVQHWDRMQRFCPSCAAPLEWKTAERAKSCARCRRDFFPPVVPALIVLVHDGPRILMTRQARFPPGMYGLVAGFLEPGETLEACAIREVREETGVEIEELRYFGSQPWPFPHQVMIGFSARYAGGALVVDHGELEDARWFHRDALPDLPPRASIARALIEARLADPAAAVDVREP